MEIGGVKIIDQTVTVTSGTLLAIPGLTRWTSYTPTFSAGFGTVTNINMHYMQMESNYIIRGTFTVGTVAASVPTITLPNGASIDTTVIDTTPINVLPIIVPISGL